MPKRRRSSDKSSKSRSAAGCSRLPRWAVILLWSVGGGVAAAVVLLALAAVLILTPPPQPMGELSVVDAQLQQQILSRVSREVFSRRPPVESKMRLSPAEVNSLLHFMVFAVTAAERLGAIPRRETAMIKMGHYAYDSGIFTAEIPILLGLRLFGGAAVLRVEGFPAKYDGKIDVSLRSCRLGRIPAPIFLAERCADRVLAAALKREKMQCLDRAVKSFEAEPNGDVTLVYRPPELLRLLLGGLK